MDEYIKREDVIKHLRGACIAKYPLSFSFGIFASADEISKLPSADVVPKSEVDEIVRQWKEEANCWQNNYITELRANEQIKVEVAWEIFEEIEKALNLSKCYGESGIYFEHDIETDIAELKKKYIPKDCRDCRFFVGCEQAVWTGP